MQDGFKRILIIKPSSLGDIVLALPALSALRRSFPDSKISWLVRPEFAGLLEGHPHLDEIFLFDRKTLSKAWYSPKACKALRSLIGQLRERKFDIVFDFQGLFRTALLSRLTGCNKRFGMANAREFASLFYTHKVVQDENCVHLVDFYLKMVREAGASDTEPEFVIPVNKDAQSSINKLLFEHKISFGNYAVLIPGSAHQEKCWPPERFAALAEIIHTQFSVPVIATGSASEKEIAEKVKSKSRAPVYNFAGRTNLKELIALLKGAKVVVSNDTGPGHIASALDTTTVIIFGYVNPARLAPYRKPQSTVAVEPFNRPAGIKNKNSR